MNLSKGPLNHVLGPLDDPTLRSADGEEVVKLRTMLADERRRCEDIRSLLDSERDKFEEERDAYAAAVSLLTSEKDEAYEAARIARYGPHAP